MARFDGSPIEKHFEKLGHPKVLAWLQGRELRVRFFRNFSRWHDPMPLFQVNVTQHQRRGKTTEEIIAHIETEIAIRQIKEAGQC